MKKSTETNNKENINIRKCIACHQRKHKSHLMRVCKNHGEILLDIDGKADGRGAYICKSSECIKKAIKTNALNRALRSKIEKELIEVLESSARRINEQNEIT